MSSAVLCVLLLMTGSLTAQDESADTGAAKPTVPKATGAKPNIIVIVTDDAGYSDFTIGGSGLIRTPHIDSISSAGVQFTNGYVSASVCSPSRAGLLTGRYQQRFGHESNIPAKFSETNGLPTTETLLPEVLRGVGYRTIALGKWHLGYADKFHPCSRGFDDFFGFLQGARSFRPIKGNLLNRLLRDRAPIEETFEYLTDELGEQAAEYIEKHKDAPFFMYLSFNAVHTPMHTKEGTLAEFSSIEKARRRKLAAMTRSLDDAVGTVLAKLKEHALRDRTLLFLINDNGGATNNASINKPLRGRKGSPFEGGIRVPFIAQWPGHLPAGKKYDHPVIALDIFPTALAAAGHEGELPNPIDGENLIPYVTGAKESAPHEVLFWRRGENWAIRKGNWKLVQKRDGPVLLFDLPNDRTEANDVAAENPEVVSDLRARYDAWNAELMEPRWQRRTAGPKPGLGKPGGLGPAGEGGGKQ